MILHYAGAQLRSLLHINNPDAGHAVYQVSAAKCRLHLSHLTPDVLSHPNPQNQPALCKSLHKQARQGNARWTPAHACQRLPEPWSEVVAGHAACLDDLQAGRHSEAYAAIISAVQPFIKVRRWSNAL